MTIYNKTELEPQRQAAEEVAGKYGIDEGELVRLLNGNYNVIADKKPGLTQEELQSKIVEIQQEHKWRKEILELKAQVKASVETSEIFANGDTGDSGFDLIHDLEIIEEILFLHTQPIDIGKSYTSSSGPGVAQVGQAGETQAHATGTDGTKTPGTTSSALTSDEDGADGGDSGAGGRASSTDGDLNPNACFGDETYEEALNEFEKKSQTDPHYRDGSAYQDESDDAGDQNVGTSQQALSTDPLPALPQPPMVYPPAPEDNWLKEALCNDIFCLSINIVSAPVTSSYANSDNCIACHVEQINDVLKTVVSHTLAPSKAPGNLGESAQCKKAIADAFGAVSMNFYAVAMPVQTPANDDLVYGTTVEEEWEEFCNRVDLFPFDDCKSPEQLKEERLEKGYQQPPILEDRAAKQAISQVPDGASQLDVTSRIDEIVATYRIQQDEELTALHAEEGSDESIVFFHPLKVELDQMNYYFTNFQTVLHSLHEEVEGFPGKQACTELKNKKECE